LNDKENTSGTKKPSQNCNGFQNILILIFYIFFTLPEPATEESILGFPL